MNTILHIIAKDLRHLWVSLLVWIAMQAALVALVWHIWTSTAYGIELPIELNVAIMGGTMLIDLLGLMFGISMLREDPPGDAGAFWVTRPIAGWELLCAKLLGFVLLLWLPSLLTAFCWWLSIGLSAPQMFAASKGEVVLLVAISMMALACAPFLRRESSLLSVLFILMLAIMGLIISGTALLTAHVIPVRSSQDLAIFPALIIVCGIIASSLCLYIWRRRVISIVLVLGAFFGSMAIIAFYPMPRFMQASKEFGNIQISETHYEGYANGRIEMKGKIGPLVSNQCFGAVPFRSPVFRTKVIRSQVDRTQEEWRSDQDVSIIDVPIGQLEEEIALGRTLPPRFGNLSVFPNDLQQGRTVAEILAADKPQAVRVPARLASFSGSLVQLTALPDLPLSEGSRIQSSEGPAMIEAVRVLDKGRIEIQLARFVPTGWKPLSVLVVDRQRSLVCRGEQAYAGFAIHLYGVIFERRLHAFDVQQLHPEPFASRAEQESWLAGLKLVQVENHTVETVVLSLKTDACSVLLPPVSETTRMRLQRNQDRQMQRERELEAQKARERAAEAQAAP
ncbi:MAG: hypothetical protein WC378_07235 [Opitutaceae bacterium]|jgi:hypothetical protein